MCLAHGIVNKMVPNFYFVQGPWRGILALTSRPRGGDWLADEISSWHDARMDIVASLLTNDEEAELGLEDERAEAEKQGLQFLSYAIQDRQVPDSPSSLKAFVSLLDRDLASGKNVVLHCRQGIGRTGLVAACLLIERGYAPEAAIASLSSIRGVKVPETEEQRNWIFQFAGSLAVSK